MDLSNDYATGDDRYPKTCQATLHLLDKHSKSAVNAPPIPEVDRSFAQRGGSGGNGSGKGGKDSKEGYNKQYWADKVCYKCQKEGHPASHCTDAKKKSTDEDDASAKSSRSLKKLEKDLKKTKKVYATLKSQLEELKEEESDLSDSDDEEGASHCMIGQCHATTGVCLNDRVFVNKKHTKDLDLRNVILMDN